MSSSQGSVLIAQAPWSGPFPLCISARRFNTSGEETRRRYSRWTLSDDTGKQRISGSDPLCMKVYAGHCTSMRHSNCKVSPARSVLPGVPTLGSPSAVPAQAATSGGGGDGRTAG